MTGLNTRRVIFLGLSDPYFTAEDGYQRAREIWTLNDWYQHIPDVPHPDRVFNIHADITAHSSDPTRFRGDVINEYNQSGAEIVTTRFFPDLHNCRPFDLSRVLDVTRDPFFASTMSVMFVQAWLEKWEEIELVGLALSTGSEYDHQVPSMLGAIKESERRGIKVIAPRRAEWEARGASIVDWHNTGCSFTPYFAAECSAPVEPFQTMRKAK